MTRRVEVPADRLAGWFDRFADRHGELAWEATAEFVVVSAASGASARCTVPFPPLAVEPQAPYGGLVEHVLRERRVGVLLVRKGGYAAGVFDGDRLVESKVGSRLVQGRAAAGGSSQQRFARRRENQARQAYAAAADCAVRIIVPAVATLDAVVVGGDRRAVDLTLADPRMAVVVPLVTARLLDVRDPRLRVLAATPERFRSVPIELTDPGGQPAGMA